MYISAHMESSENLVIERRYRIRLQEIFQVAPLHQHSPPNFLRSQLSAPYRKAYRRSAKPGSFRRLLHRQKALAVVPTPAIALARSPERLPHCLFNDRLEDYCEGFRQRVIQLSHLPFFNRLRSAVVLPPVDPDLWTQAQSRVARGFVSCPG